MLNQQQLDDLTTIINSSSAKTNTPPTPTSPTTIRIYHNTSLLIPSSCVVVSNSNKDILQQLIAIGFEEGDSTTVALVIQNDKQKVDSLQQALEKILNVKATVVTSDSPRLMNKL